LNGFCGRVDDHTPRDRPIYQNKQHISPEFDFQKKMLLFDEKNNEISRIHVAEAKVATFKITERKE
jgi:hypothetical protein